MAPRAGAARDIELPVEFIRRYRLGKLLGTGGMGVVHEAEQLATQRLVAVKFLTCADDDESLARFLREAQLVARVQHPHVLRVYDYGAASGCAYLVTEILTGGSLLERIQTGGAMPVRHVLEIARQFLDGLEACHAQGIVHRDLKPANVMYDGAGDLRIVDFGVAQAADARALTATGAVLGTPMYMAPEQVRGDSATASADIYAAGALLFELVTGRPPFVTKTVIEMLGAHEKRVPERADALHPEVPAHVADALAAALAKLPADRPASARAFLERLVTPGAKARTGRARSLRAASAPNLPRSGRTSRVLRAAAALGVAFALAAAGRVAWRPAPVASGVSPPVASSKPPSVAAPATASPAGHPPSVLTAQGRRHTGFLSQLKLGGATAKRAIDELKARTQLDLGYSAANWMFWIELDARLARGATGAQPRDRAAARDSMTMLDERVLYSALGQREVEFSPKLIPLAIRTAATMPDDMRSWLLLGRVLEKEGRVADAPPIYRLALALPVPSDAKRMPQTLWAALARALMTVPGHDLETEWPAMLPAQGSLHVWPGFRAATGPDYRKVLVGMLAKCRDLDQTVRVLAEVAAHSAGDPERARELWRAALAHPSASPSLRETVLAYLCGRGLVAHARELAPQVGGDWPELVELTAGKGTTALAEGPGRRLRAMRELEQGHVDAAAALIQGVPGPPTLLLELYGEARRPAWVDPLVRELAASPGGTNAVLELAGVLTAPARTADFDALLAATGASTGASHTLRALRLSRQGRHEAALAEIETSFTFAEEGLTQGWAACEVLARPLLDPATPAAVRARAIAIKSPLFSMSGEAEYYLYSLRKGDPKHAYTLARAMRDNAPQHLFWPLACVLHGDDVAQDRERLAAIVRWTGCGRWAINAAAKP